MVISKSRLASELFDGPFPVVDTEICANRKMNDTIILNEMSKLKR